MPSSGSSALSPDERAVVAQIVDAAPALTESTRSRLAALLGPPGERDGALDAIRNAFRGSAA